MDEMEAAGMSESEIAGNYGISRMALWKLRRKMGWPQLSRSDKGKIGSRVPEEEQRQKRRAYMRELYHAGKLPKYKHIRVGKITMAESRYIVSQVLGRKLKRGEVVHHIDGNPQNNNNNNLLVCSQSYHLALRRAMKMREANQSLLEKEAAC